MWSTQSRLRGWSRWNWLPLEVSQARSPRPPTAQRRQEDAEAPRFKPSPPPLQHPTTRKGLCGDWTVQLDAFSDLTVGVGPWDSGHFSHPALPPKPPIPLGPHLLCLPTQYLLSFSTLCPHIHAPMSCPQWSPGLSLFLRTELKQHFLWEVSLVPLSGQLAQDWVRGSPLPSAPCPRRPCVFCHPSHCNPAL